MSKKIIATLGVLGFLASAGIAFADTGATNDMAVVPVSTVAAQPMVLTVNASGDVLIRGTVVSTTTSSLTIKSWGGTWTVNVPATASLLPQGTTLTNLAAGDFVGVHGSINSSASWTVDATLIRDWTERSALTQQIKSNKQAVQEAMSGAPRTVQGTVSNLDASAQTFTLAATNGTSYAVSLAANPILLTSNRATLMWSQVQNGDTVRVFGTIASSTISASIFRDVSVK